MKYVCFTPACIAFAYFLRDKCSRLSALQPSAPTNCTLSFRFVQYICSNSSESERADATTCDISLSRRSIPVSVSGKLLKTITPVKWFFRAMNASILGGKDVKSSSPFASQSSRRINSIARGKRLISTIPATSRCDRLNLTTVGGRNSSATLPAGLSTPLQPMCVTSQSLHTTRVHQQGFRTSSSRQQRLWVPMLRNLRTCADLHMSFIINSSWYTSSWVQFIINSSCWWTVIGAVERRLSWQRAFGTKTQHMDKNIDMAIID